MKSITAVLLLLAWMPTTAQAQAFDWSSLLGKSSSELRSALGGLGRCSDGGFPIPVRWVSKNTSLTDDLFDLVETPGAGIVPIDGKQVPGFDYDNSRAFQTPKLASIKCTVGREATVEAYTYESRIFRIKLSFDRCESRELRENKFFGNILGSQTPLLEERCDGVDIAEKDFDKALFQSIKSRGKYGYDREGSPGLLDFRWNRNMDGEFAQAEQRSLWDVLCYGHQRSEISNVIPPSGMSFRCLIDVENSDPSRWSATAMYELLQPGTIFDSVYARLTAMRLFIDMPSEKMAARAVHPELQAMVSTIKSKIANGIADKDAKESAVSNILGAGN